MTATTYRVACPDHTQVLPSLAAAQGHLSGVETADHCAHPHTIEVSEDGGGWVPLHIALARHILAAAVAATVDTVDGPLVKAAGSWSAKAGVRADAAGAAGSDAWFAALGPHEDTLLTGDGKGVQTNGWCRCTNAPDAQAWVRYERWTGAGRVGHGYACPTCRLITQTA